MTSCMICDVPLVRVANRIADEWMWAGPDGKVTGTDPDLAHIQDPYAHLAWLGEEIMRGSRQRGRRAEPTWLWWARGLEYSALKVRLQTGTWHTHHADPASEPAWEGGPVPVHCGWPAWLRPSGWQCRQCATPLTGRELAAA